MHTLENVGGMELYHAFLIKEILNRLEVKGIFEKEDLMWIEAQAKDKLGGYVINKIKEAKEGENKKEEEVSQR